jgi:hypothetical protein
MQEHIRKSLVGKRKKNKNMLCRVSDKYTRQRSNFAERVRRTLGKEFFKK